MPPLINIPIPIVISIAAALGVFIHDTQLDNVVKTSAEALPAIVSDIQGGLSELESRSQHIHSETGTTVNMPFNMASQQPAAPPRNKDDKKYVTQKRLNDNNFGNDYIWPSI